MPFVPRSGQHALIETVFGFFLSRPFAPKEIDAIKGKSADWRELLPRASDINMQEVEVSPQGVRAPRLTTSTGVAYERMKPDGSISWRLWVNEENVFVNCLEYTRWHDIWPQVKSILISVANTATDRSLRIKAVQLQTIDAFDWQGAPNDYDITNLLQVGGESVPRHIANRGAAWHLHQGWFSNDVNAFRGRLLNRINIDATDGNQSQVRMDCTLHCFVADQISLLDAANEGSALYTGFEQLHIRNKALLEEFLNPNIAAQIGLTGGN